MSLLRNFTPAAASRTTTSSRSRTSSRTSRTASSRTRRAAGGGHARRHRQGRLHRPGDGHRGERGPGTRPGGAFRGRHRARSRRIRRAGAGAGARRRGPCCPRRPRVPWPSRPRLRRSPAASACSRRLAPAQGVQRHWRPSRRPVRRTRAAGRAAGGQLAPDITAPLLSDAAELRTRWQRVQGDFVDDPQAAVSDAADLVEQTAEALVDALRQRQRQLRAAWERGAADGASRVDGARRDGAGRAGHRAPAADDAALPGAVQPALPAVVTMPHPARATGLR